MVVHKRCHQSIITQCPGMMIEWKEPEVSTLVEILTLDICTYVHIHTLHWHSIGWYFIKNIYVRIYVYNFGAGCKTENTYVHTYMHTYLRYKHLSSIDSNMCVCLYLTSDSYV